METKNELIDSTINGEGGKNAVWTYDKIVKLSVVTFPKGDIAEFNLAEIVKGANEQQEALIVYGHKQLLASNSSAATGASAKVDKMCKDHEDLCTTGVELSETGKIRFIGRVRENGTGASENKILAQNVKKILADPISLTSLLLKRQLHPTTFTEEDTKTLNRLVEEAYKLQQTQDTKELEPKKAKK